jgi:hypothetical protein
MSPRVIAPVIAVYRASEDTVMRVDIVDIIVQIEAIEHTLVTLCKLV